MWGNNVQRLLTITGVAILLLFPADAALQLGGIRGGNMGELLTASLIGAILGGARHRIKMQREKEDTSQQQPRPSAQHHHPVVMPWAPNVLHQQALMQASNIASQMLPSFHHQMIHPQVDPFYQDMTPLLLQLNQEQQAFRPLSSHSSPSAFANQAFPDLNGFDNFPALDGLQSWQNLPTQQNMDIPNLMDYRNQ